jgi:NADH-quinone oxidoreductase subunit M
MGMFFAMASLGLPGLGNFVGEFLVLLGAYQVNIAATVFATIGLIFATVYSLWIIQQTFQGEKRETWEFTDYKFRNMAIMGAMVVVLVWLGLFPKPVLDTAKPAVQKIQRTVQSAEVVDEGSYLPLTSVDEVIFKFEQQHEDN